MHQLCCSCQNQRGAQILYAKDYNSVKTRFCRKIWNPILGRDWSSLFTDAFAPPQHSFQRAMNSKDKHQLQDLHTGVQVKQISWWIQSIPFCLWNCFLYCFLSGCFEKCCVNLINIFQVNRPSKECPTTPPLLTVMQPKERDRKDQTLSQVSFMLL